MEDKLRGKQLELLLLIYKLRFVTVELVVSITEAKSSNRIRERLNKLADDGYVYRRYDSSYRLQNRHAEYCLNNRGISALRNVHDCNPVVLHNMYKDKTAAPATIEHRLVIARVYSLFKGDTVRFLTQTQISTLTGLPKRLPDALLAVETGDGAACFFVEVLLESQPFFVSVHRVLKRYVEYYQSGDWEIEQPDAPLPTVLFICDTYPLQKRVTKRISKLLELSWDESLQMYGTTLEGIERQGSAGAIWQSMNNTEELRSFVDLLGA